MKSVCTELSFCKGSGCNGALAEASLGPLTRFAGCCSLWIALSSSLIGFSPHIRKSHTIAQETAPSATITKPACQGRSACSCLCWWLCAGRKTWPCAVLETSNQNGPPVADARLKLGSWVGPRCGALPASWAKCRAARAPRWVAQHPFFALSQKRGGLLIGLGASPPDWPSPPCKSNHTRSSQLWLIRLNF